MNIVTRFAPSPTGLLHLGGARTALFNWLFSRHNGGKFFLRIEDTDRKRSTDEAVEAIISGLNWLELDWDGEFISQFSRRCRHDEIVKELLRNGNAYKCYCTPDELDQMRETARQEGRPWRYDGIWRDRDDSEAPKGVDPVIRLKVAQSGETIISDIVQGPIKVSNETLDDMVLMRGDGTPTYMLAVVVDDYDMGVTHIIRGDDHLTNTFRQYQIYIAMGWAIPEFAHIPLIHAANGEKMSKRHGAIGISSYKDQGFLPAAMRNYLLRLGWGYGNEEIISTQKAIELFSLSNIGRAPSRFNLDKLTNLNGHYIRLAEDEELVNLIAPILANEHDIILDDTSRSLLKKAMGNLKLREKNIVDLAKSSTFFVTKRPLTYNSKALEVLNEDNLLHIHPLRDGLALIDTWESEVLENYFRSYVASSKPPCKLGTVAQPIRVALSGATISPPIFEVMNILGKDETLGRIDDFLLFTNNKNTE